MSITESKPDYSSSMDPDLILFALNSSGAFGEAVSQHLGLALSPHEEREFEDGEHKARSLINVRDKDVFVVQSLYGDSRQSGNDKLCRLLFFIGALKDAGAARVTAVAPYLAYARKDRKTKPRDPITTRYVAALFEAVGTDAVLTLDVHNLAAFQNAFRCRSEHLEAAGLFVQQLLASVSKEGGKGDAETVVVSPDAGGLKRAEQFRQRLSKASGKLVGIAMAEKYRSGGVVSGQMLVGEVSGKNAIIIDDLISSGGTLMRTAKVCKEHGAASVIALATHGLFTVDAAETLADDALQKIVVTDSVPPFRLEGKPVREKVAVIRCSGLFAEAICRLHNGESIAALTEF